jgi:hypothetical protein
MASFPRRKAGVPRGTINGQCSLYPVKIEAELTVQHDRGPHVPPLNPEWDPPDEEPESDEQEQLKVETIFLTSLDSHFGQTVFFSVIPIR